MTASWIEKLGAFFADGRRRTSLARVLDAAGCREGWLQGELFDEFGDAPGFQLNVRGGATDSVPDLSVGEAMIGELKIIGAGYQTKCITGGAIKPFVSRADRKVRPRDRKELNLGDWGLIPDYFRLRDATGLERDTERLLILVADVEPLASGSVADAVRTIDFEARRSSQTISFPRGFTRIWDVADTAAP